MEFKEKPKCRGCNEKGEEKVYIWQPDLRGKGGYLWHYECYTGIAKEINNGKNN